MLEIIICFTILYIGVSVIAWFIFYKPMIIEDEDVKPSEPSVSERKLWIH